MTAPHDDDALESERIEQLVQFDEALRLGRQPDSEAGADPEMRKTQDFLVLLQSVWQRRSQSIGPFAVIRMLGSGSLGPSYLVEHPKSKNPCVLRILWPDLHTRSEVRQQLLVEAKSVQFLKHPRILRLLQIQTADSCSMFVSDYSPGVSLSEWRQRQVSALPWRAVLGVVANIADILESAHQNGFIHGNLKPSNLFLACDIEVTLENLHQTAIQVGEFALAQAVLQSHLHAHNGLPWPMPQYLAPEQLVRREKSAEVSHDVYALGVLLYELLTNHSPALGASRDVVFAQTRDAPVTPPREICPSLPEEVSAVAMMCLHKQPKRRPGSAKSVADACRTILSGSAPSWWRRWLNWR
jgi:serine/threonine protein kinase